MPPAEKRWSRIDLDQPILQVCASKERARELGLLNLPPGSKFFLIEYEDAWAWIFLGLGAEECIVPE